MCLKAGWDSFYWTVARCLQEDYRKQVVLVCPEGTEGSVDDLAYTGLWSRPYLQSQPAARR